LTGWRIDIRPDTSPDSAAANPATSEGDDAARPASPPPVD